MKTILFDGVCNLCNQTVDFVISRDKKGVFRFASLQSEAGIDLMNRLGKDPTRLNSIVLADGDKTYEKSDAALRIAAGLGGVYKLSGLFLILPRFVRDPFYDLIAKNRYRWFGKRDTCRLPTAEEKKRFL